VKTHVVLVLAGLACCGAAHAQTNSEEPLFRAVLGARLRLATQTHAASARPLLCVGMDPGGAVQSVRREFLDAFRERARLRRLAECEVRGAGVVERTSGRTALIVTLGPVEWRAADEAWVREVELARPRQPLTRTYRVVHEHDGWICLGPIMKDGPAD
jgi:hypothetical protein